MQPRCQVALPHALYHTANDADASGSARSASAVDELICSIVAFPQSRVLQGTGQAGQASIHKIAAFYKTPGALEPAVVLRNDTA